MCCLCLRLRPYLCLVFVFTFAFAFVFIFVSIFVFAFAFVLIFVFTFPFAFVFIFVLPCLRLCLRRFGVLYKGKVVRASVVRGSFRITRSCDCPVQSGLVNVKRGLAFSYLILYIFLPCLVWSFFIFDLSCLVLCYL